MLSVRTGLRVKYQKEFCCANDYVVGKWLHCDAAYNILRTSFVSCLLGNHPWLFSVLPDKHWVRVFLKWHKAGLANMRHSSEVFAAVGHVHNLSNTV